MKTLKDFLPEILRIKEKYQNVHHSLSITNEQMHELKIAAEDLISQLNSLRTAELNLIDRIEKEIGYRPTADDFFKIING